MEPPAPRLRPIPMTPRIRIFVPPYNPDCPHCRRLIETEARRPDWRDWFSGPTHALPTTNRSD